MDSRLIDLLTTSSGSPEAQHHILQYFEELTVHKDGWKICGRTLNENLSSDESVQFFCLQVIEAHIKSSYLHFDNALKEDMKNCLRGWYMQCLLEKRKNYILNKTAQLFCLVFIQDYPTQWHTFFSELLSTVEKGAVAVDLYLRVLLALDEEVVVRHIPHTQQEFERNTAIKDHMRDDCVNNLVDSWYHIIETYHNTSSELTCLCLKVIGAYVSWIDINLIANDMFISHLLAFLSNKEIRECSCECLLEIINKGMEPGPKTALVESLAGVLEKTGVMSANYQDDETDFVAKVSALLNGMGEELVTSFNKLAKCDSEDALKMEILQAIDNKIPALLRFLGDEDDNVSEAVFEFCHAYLVLVKQLNGNNLPQANKHVKGVIQAVIKKLKYDNDYDFENESDDEVDFLEYRKHMKVLYNYLAKLDGKLFITSIHEIITNSLKNWHQLPFKEVEVAIYVLYCLAEAFPGQELFNDAENFAAFQSMMSLLVESNVNQHTHFAVKLQYFETVTRYERFFYANTQHIPTVLVSFMDERGLKNGKTQVASRCCFLLMRFIKSLKNQMPPYVSDVFLGLQDFLQNNETGTLSHNDKYYLYEVAAILITCCHDNSEKQVSMMNVLTSPLLQHFQTNMEKITSETVTDEIEMKNLAEELHHIMAYMSRVSKAFTTPHNLKQSGCTECFTNALTVFLHSLSIRVHRDTIHNACRQYLHRMIVCLGEQVLPFIPVAVNSLLKDCEMRDIQEFIPLINQLTHRFKNTIGPFLSEIFMPLVTQIFTFIQLAVEENDFQAIKEKQLLQRSYFLFISTVASSGLLEVFTNQETNSVKEILLSIVHGSVEIPDPQGQKSCFATLNLLVKSWGGEESFKEFIYESILPACFMAPLKPEFDLEDAQTAFALQEIANTQKSCVEKRGEAEVVQFLQQHYLPQQQCPQNVAMEYTNALQTMNAKTLKKFLHAFYLRTKS